MHGCYGLSFLLTCLFLFLSCMSACFSSLERGLVFGCTGSDTGWACLEGAQKCCSVLRNQRERKKQTSHRHDFDVIVQQKKESYLPTLTVTLEGGLEHRHHYTLLISLNKRFCMYRSAQSKPRTVCKAVLGVQLKALRKNRKLLFSGCQRYSKQYINMIKIVDSIQSEHRERGKALQDSTLSHSQRWYSNKFKVKWLLKEEYCLCIFQNKVIILSPWSCSFEPQNISAETFKNILFSRFFPLSNHLMLAGGWTGD